MQKIFASFWLLFLVPLWTQAQLQDALWMRYPAISPDGQSIVFSYKGDLYSMPAAGGEAKPLTQHSAHDFMPVWSKDSRSIAFASDRYGNFDIFTMPAEGGGPKRLTFHSTDDYPSDFSGDGRRIFFSSLRVDDVKNQQFPYARLPELYAVPATGGRVEQITSAAAEYTKVSRKGDIYVFQDKKGYEDPWRKHHQSSVTRDIWLYEPLRNKSFSRLTDFGGEDREPVLSKDAKTLYYLSEESGSLNVYSLEIRGKKNKKQLTNFDKHPIRFLSISDEGLLCFQYNGELYTLKPGANAQKLQVQIASDWRSNPREIVMANRAGEFALSPNGKEVAYVYRGEIFVSSMEAGTTKRITNTPEQERSISFSPDGRSILYASEREESWNLYQTSLAREEEKYFFNATLLQEETILASDKETFQPAYSPDGKEVAFLEERTRLKVINLESKKERTILEKDRNYSYSDGDQYYQWSPDGKWFLLEFLQENQWISEIGLVAADGKTAPVNLSRSGYNDGRPKWSMNGESLIWFSDRKGMRNHASWGSQNDVFALFLTQDAYDRYRLSKEDYQLLKEEEEEKKKASKKGEKKDKEEKTAEDKELKPLNIELEGIEDRIARLTIHSASLADAVMDKEGETLYYLAAFEKGYDLWATNLRTKKTEIVQKLGGSGSSLILDKKGEKLYFGNRGQIQEMELKSKKVKTVRLKGEMELQSAEERAYLFEHIWRQVKRKFYLEDLHGVDWDLYKKEYARFLPHINNGYDFAEMASELLGELNASHTGCRYAPNKKGGDQTAALGIYMDYAYDKEGIKIAKILKGSPLDKADIEVAAGDIIEAIDGQKIGKEDNFWPLLNRKAGDHILLTIYNSKEKSRQDIRIKPISFGQEFNLRYEDWVESRHKMVEELSDGQLGYVHVKGMNNSAFQQVYSDALGRHYNKKALIVDTRFNGGGWLHDDLASFLSGEVYLKIRPRGQKIGTEPMFKWSRPSLVLMSEGNYSDAHMFPYVYKALGIGKLIGMPVPGTATAVWWERLQNGMVFGIPQVGMETLEGQLLENTQLEPDIMVRNDYEKMLNGRDEQIEAAVKELQRQLKAQNADKQ